MNKIAKFVLCMALFSGLIVTSYANSSNAADLTLIVSPITAEAQIQQAQNYLDSGDFNKAYIILETLQPALNQITEMHSQLFNTLKEESNASVTAEEEKRLTIEYAKLRDKAAFLSGKVNVKKGDHLEAAKHFVMVVQSQRTTELGEKAYTALRELGFSPKLNITNR